MKGLSLDFPDGVVDPVVLNNYPINEMDGIEAYSRLKFSQAELNIGGNYAFTGALSLVAQAGYRMFEDDDPYVYGDQDGDSYYGNLGIAYRF